MNGLPTEMIDRWQDRPEAAPGERRSEAACAGAACCAKDRAGTS
jgi:hypothetical protein